MIIFGATRDQPVFWGAAGDLKIILEALVPVVSPRRQPSVPVVGPSRQSSVPVVSRRSQSSAPVVSRRSQSSVVGPSRQSQPSIGPIRLLIEFVVHILTS